VSVPAVLTVIFRRYPPDVVVFRSAESDWIALYQQKLRHPARLTDRVRELVEAPDWAGLDRLVEGVDPHFYKGLQPVYLHELDLLERRLLLEISPLLAQTGGWIAQLSRAVRYIVEAKIPGDFVECGVYKGTSIVTMIRTLQSLDISDRHI